MAGARRDPQRPLIDLPLPGRSVEEPDSATPPPTVGHRRSRWPTVVLLLLLPVAALAGYFWPRRGPALLRASSSALDLGSARVGSSGETSTLEIRNGGERQLEVAGVRITGDHAEDFQARLSGCREIPLLPGASCVAEVISRPSARGDRRATLLLDSDAPNSPIQVALRSSGLEPEGRFTRSSLRFDPIAVGRSSEQQRLRLENVGTAPLKITASQLTGDGRRDFVLSFDGCAGRRLSPGEGCEMALAFSPNSPGDRRARVVLSSDDPAGRLEADLVASAGEAYAELRLDRETIDFGAQRLGGRSAPQAIAIDNPGTRPLEIDRLRVDDPAFEVAEESCTQDPIEPEGQCLVAITFAPRRQGQAAARLRFASNARGDTEVALSGRSVAPSLQLSADEISFRPAAVGAAADRGALALSNVGSAPLALAQLAIAGPDRDGFRLAADSCSGRSLRPEESCEVQIEFRARKAKGYEATLRIASDATTEPRLVLLRAEGLAGQLELSTNRLDFGSMAVAERRLERLTVRNRGRAPLEIRRLELDQGEADFRIQADGCSPQPVLPPDGSCALAIAFEPRREGRLSARLLVHAANARAAIVSLEGNAIQPREPRLLLLPQEIDFGEVPTGARSSIRTVTLSNEGNGAYPLDDLQLVGAGSDGFDIVPGTCDGIGSLSAESRCTVGVRFQPFRSGTFVAELVARRRDGGSESRMALSGMAPAISVDPLATPAPQGP